MKTLVKPLIGMRLVVNMTRVCASGGLLKFGAAGEKLVIRERKGANNVKRTGLRKPSK